MDFYLLIGEQFRAKAHWFMPSERGPTPKIEFSPCRSHKITLEASSSMSRNYLSTFNVRRVFLMMAEAILVTACAHSQVTLFPQNSTVKIANPNTTKATQPESVGIYRSAIPFDSFIEIGLITLRTKYFDLPSIYERLRIDSAQQGAQAVVAVKTNGETHKEWVTERKCEQKTDCSTTSECSSHEVCHDEQTLEEVSSFLTEGSMIRRKQ